MELEDVFSVPTPDLGRHIRLHCVSTEIEGLAYRTRILINVSYDAVYYNLECIVLTQNSPKRDLAWKRDYLDMDVVADIPHPAFPVELRKEWLDSVVQRGFGYKTVLSEYPGLEAEITKVHRKAVDVIVADSFFRLR